MNSGWIFNMRQEANFEKKNLLIRLLIELISVIIAKCCKILSLGVVNKYKNRLVEINIT